MRITQSCPTQSWGEVSLCWQQSDTAGHCWGSDVITSPDKAVWALSPFVIMIPAPSNTEKKTHINGYASPSHLAVNVSNTHAGKQSKSKCLPFFLAFRSRLLFWLHCYCFGFILWHLHHLSDVEGYMKTDDRMRLAKERREERERSLGMCCPVLFFFQIQIKRDWLKILFFSAVSLFSPWCCAGYYSHNWLWESLASQ